MTSSLPPDGRRDRVVRPSAATSRRDGAPGELRTADRLYETAAHLFRTKGYAASTTRELAQMLGIQKATLYHHMKGKEDLLFEISKQALLRIREAVASVAESEPTALRLRAMIETHVVYALRDRDMHASMLIELGALGPERKTEIIRRRDEYEKLLRDAVAADQADGRLRDDVEPRYLTLALLNLLNWTIFWFDPDGDMSPLELGEMLASIFLDGARATRG